MHNYNRENWNKHVKCHRWTEQQGVENLVLSGGKQSPPSPRPSHRPESAETAAEGKVVYHPVYWKARSYMTLPVVLPQQVKRISKLVFCFASQCFANIKCNDSYTGDKRHNLTGHGTEM